MKKPIHIVISLLLAITALLVWMSTRPAPAVVKSEVLQPVQETACSAEPVAEEVSLILVEPVAVAKEPKQPVQSVEERGDAMLFEIDALQAMPFDQAVVMPFD